MRGSRSELQGGVLLLALTVLASTPGVARAPDTDVARYRDETRPRVSVRGRVFEESRRPGAPERPLAETVVTLFPRSEAFLRRLAVLKATSRDSVEAYAHAVPAIRRAREDHERALREAGAADLIHTRLVAVDGTFTFDSVARGEWVLMGWRSVSGHERAAGRQARKESRRFAPTPRVVTSQMVTVWLRELSVEPRVLEIELTDRNVWFSGLVDVMAPGAER